MVDLVRATTLPNGGEFAYTESHFIYNRFSYTLIGYLWNSIIVQN
jgi:hypothetical protein